MADEGTGSGSLFDRVMKAHEGIMEAAVNGFQVRTEAAYQAARRALL